MLNIKTDDQLNSFSRKKNHIRSKAFTYIWNILNNKHVSHIVNTGITDGYQIPVIINNTAQLYATVIDK